MAKTTRKKTAKKLSTAKSSAKKTGRNKKAATSVVSAEVPSTATGSVRSELPRGIPSEMFFRFIEDARYRKRLLASPAKVIAKDHPELGEETCAELAKYIENLDAETAEHVSALNRLAIC